MLLRKSLKSNFSTQTRNRLKTKSEWIQPEGHDTGIKIYHEIVKERVPLIFPNPNYVKWYMCGPTVYDTSHIGHASCYIKSDIIRRILKEYYNIEAVVAIGVTDVSEKIVNKCKSLNVSYKELTKKYENEFFTQMKELNILPPSLILRVTDHMTILSDFVEQLVNKGAAYKTVDGSIYFKTVTDPNYGRFREPVVDNDQEIVPGKFNGLDFALWKGNKHSPWRKGLPGWHIQCSAMASHVFGSSIDLHSGGADLIFPHHENEESQSTSYHGCQQWVNYWLHLGLLNTAAEKMSKSLNNFVSIEEFLRSNTGDHLRMYCMMSPYRNSAIYDSQAIELAVNICDKVVRFLRVSESYIKGTWLMGDIKEAELLEEMEKSKKVIKEHLSNDFGAHEALKSILLLIQKATKMLNENVGKETVRSPAVVASVSLYVNTFFKSFGFSFAEKAGKRENPTALEALVDAAVNFRINVREKALLLEKRNKLQIMNLCDEVRDNLRSIGVTMNDLSPSHTHWSLKTDKLSNGSALKNVIDVLVWFRSEILKLVPSLSSIRCQQDLTEICRSAKMHLSTLGVIIVDSKSGRSSWSFPKVDSEGTSKFEVIIDSTLTFYADIRKIALSLTDENVQRAKAKEDILALCDSALANLQSFGVTVNGSDASNLTWLLEVNNSKGVSVLQNVMDMIMHSREQVKSLLPFAKDESTSMKLENICFKTKKFLQYYGLNITDKFGANSPATWSMNENMRNKIYIRNVIDVLVMFMSEIRAAAEPLEDVEMKKLLLDIYSSLEKDLKGVGVVLNTDPNGTTWSFKECEAVSEFTR